MRSGPRTMDLPHDERWSAAHLEVNPTHVLAHHPDREDEEAEKDEQDREEREHALALGPDDQPAHEEEEAESHPGERNPDPDQRDELNRDHREPGHHVEAEAHEAEER